MSVTVQLNVTADASLPARTLERFHAIAVARGMTAEDLLAEVIDRAVAQYRADAAGLPVETFLAIQQCGGRIPGMPAMVTDRERSSEWLRVFTTDPEGRELFVRWMCGAVHSEAAALECVTQFRAVLTPRQKGGAK